MRFVVFFKSQEQIEEENVLKVFASDSLKKEGNVENSNNSIANQMKIKIIANGKIFTNEKDVLVAKKPVLFFCIT